MLKCASKMSPSISLSKGEMLGADGMNVNATLPPDFLQKIREVIAVGIAKNLINKALAELQSENTLEKP